MDQLIGGLLGGGGAGGNQGDGEGERRGGGGGGAADLAGDLIGGLLGGGGGGSSGGHGGGGDLLSTLFGAIKNADFGNILNSISGGADVNSKDPSTGNTALQMAIMAGLTEIVKLLLNKGANVNQTNDEGKDAVKIAQEQAEQAPEEEKPKYEEMVQMLQQRQ